MKKLTLEFIKEEIEKVGYRCLSEEYINSKTKLKVQCDKGHLWEATWSYFQQGDRCSICSGNKRNTIEEVKNYIEKFGYKCLSEEYKNTSTILEVQCNKNHIYKTSWANFKKGSRCRICDNGGKKTIEEISIFVNEFGYKCLSKVYVGSKSKIIFMCNKNHVYKMTWSCILSGQRCPKCAIENKSGENSYQWKNYTEEDRKNIKFYRDEVMKLSKINYKKYYHIINPNNLKRGRNKFHLDHIYSIIDGFNNSVPPKIIASPINLRMLTENKNVVKNGNSHMSLEQLYFLYEQFNRENKSG